LEEIDQKIRGRGKLHHISKKGVPGGKSPPLEKREEEKLGSERLKRGRGGEVLVRGGMKNVRA